MSTILPYVQNEAFGPLEIASMERALDEVCAALGVNSTAAREVIAVRIIDLARRGERDSKKIRDRLLLEENGGSHR